VQIIDGLGQRLGLAILVLALAACGGGGGGGDSSGPGTVADEGPRPPQATVVRDDNPTAARLAVGPADFFPTASSGRWVFDRLDDGGGRLGATTLDLTPSGSELRLVEAEDGQAWDETILRRDAGGWVVPDLRNTLLPAAAVAIIGELMQYPAPFHAIGSTRVQFRSGNYGVDIDADGVNESFEFEFGQTMVGYETVAGPNGPIEALHIRDELLLTVIPSKRGSANLRASAVSDDWLARGVGPVRGRVRSIGSEGRDVFPPYTLALSSVRIGGLDPLDLHVIAEVQILDIANRDLVFDAPRGRYYASVPGRVVGQGNRIAVIDAASGAVSYSAVVGSEPGVMALAADGASLYVALDGSSELLRLGLPGLVEVGRMRLPVDPASGPYVTESLAASPVDPGVVALSLAHTSLSPRHAGVLLVRAMVGMPQRTQGHTGSNSIVFGSDGQSLYGLNNETTEFGLRRIEVLADGLAERQVLRDAVGQFYLKSIDRTAHGLVLGNRLYAEGTLAPLGIVNGAFECRALPTLALACVTSAFDRAFGLLVADAVNGTVTARLAVPADTDSWHRNLVAGPSGRLAVRDRIEHPARREAARIILLRHAALL
jgi:hypothetical protein